MQCSPPFYFISKFLSVLSFHFLFVCEFTHVVVYMFLCKGRRTGRSYRTLDVSPYLTYLLRQVLPSAVWHCICQADFPINFGESPASSCHPTTAALGLQILVTLPDITWVLGIWTQVLMLYPVRHFPSPTALLLYMENLSVISLDHHVSGDQNIILYSDLWQR